MESGESVQERIEVKFVTSDTSLRVPDTPIAVPVTLTRLGLSEVVNRLLALDPPRPFDFLVRCEPPTLLRSTLAGFLSKRGITKESLVVLEYFEALPFPEPGRDLPHEDWVSCVAGGSGKCFVTGCYDTQARVWSIEGDCFAVGSGHTGPIKGVALLHETPKGCTFATASTDHTLRTWKASAKRRTAETEFVYSGHQDSIEAVAVNPSITRLCSGSWDKALKIWDLVGTSTDQDGSTPDANPSKRKKRGDKGAPPEQLSLRSLEGHMNCVSAVTWPREEIIYSGGHDHSVRGWDVEANANPTLLTGSKAVTSISYSHVSGQLATGHTDRMVCIWDPRSTAGQVVKFSLASHGSWVTSVAWSPVVGNVLLSGSHDGTVKLWDLRSNIPLMTIEGHQDKVLCVGWQGDRTILSGGCDNVLKVHQLTKVPTGA